MLGQRYFGPLAATRKIFYYSLLGGWGRIQGRIQGGVYGPENGRYHAGFGSEHGPKSGPKNGAKMDRKWVGKLTINLVGNWAEKRVSCTQIVETHSFPAQTVWAQRAGKCAGKWGRS